MSEEHSARSEKKKITLKMLYRVMAVIGILILVVLIINTARINAIHKSLDQTVDDYISAQEDASNMTQASDYLTEQVRAFALTLDKSCMDNYFYEADVTQRRDKAVANMRQAVQTLGEETLHFLEESLRYSNELMNTEIYAFRLGAESKGLKISELPEAVRAVSLTAADVALSAAEKQQKAIELVYSIDYADAKSNIRSNVNSCSENLMDSIRQREKSNSDMLRGLLRLQYTLIVVVMILIVAYLISVHHFVIYPVEKFINSIRNHERFDHSGVQEISFLAASYNEVYDKTREDQSKLSYEATHDSLTGVYNRAAYEDIMASHKDSEMAFMIIDIDRFKQFNDNYGHAVGDKVLKRVSAVLKRNFRSEDFICRIGGDEFVVIMVNADSSLGPLICGKLGRIAKALGEETDDVPAITLSIGVAFSDRKNPQGTIFEDADKALYDSKEKGKNTYSFYEYKAEDDITE